MQRSKLFHNKFSFIKNRKYFIFLLRKILIVHEKVNYLWKTLLQPNIRNRTEKSILDKRSFINKSIKTKRRKKNAFNESEFLIINIPNY